MKNYKITAMAPTVYQYGSLRHFGGDIKKHGNGSFSINIEFETEQQAKDYLIERVSYYSDTEEELNEAIERIERCGSVQMDAVSGYISEIE